MRKWSTPVGLVVFAGLAALLVGKTAYSAEVVASLSPDIGYTWVDGDNDKFRAHHWLEDRLEGGIEHFTLEQEDLGNDYSLRAEGHAQLSRADYEYEMEVIKEDWSKLEIAFEQFRKYYDSTGGVYPGFSSLNGYDANRDLYLDIGKFEIVYEVTPENLPDVAIAYEFEYKRGAKSRLTWASAQEGGVTKKIMPSWQEISEDVHHIDLSFSDTWHGTGWKIEQVWEKAVSHNTRREINAATATTASLNKLRDQEIEPSSGVLETVFELDRWLIKDKLHGGTAYRYGQIEASEWESIFEMSATGVPGNFGNAENVREAVARNYLRTHTGVANLMWIINNAWTAMGKLKLEDATRRSSSTHPMDRAGAAPDNIIDQNDISETSNGIVRAGEALSIRFSGIPHMAIYNDLEMEQVQNSLQENRQSNSAGEVFARQTDGNFYRGTETLGLRWWPNERLKMNSQYRFRRENGDLDDRFETNPDTTGAKSAFVDSQREVLNEISSRFQYRFCEWFEPGFRYQFRNQEFGLRYEANPLEIESTNLSHIYTVDVSLQPTQALTVSPSFQLQDAFVETAADGQSPNNYPALNADVWTVSVSSDYAVSRDLTATSTVQYQRADNFQDLTHTVFYGVDYNAVDLTVGLRWTGWKKGVVIEPRYGFYHYEPDERVEFGGYDAHVAWLGVHIDWA